MATLRRRVRTLRRGEPRDPAQLSELTLAAAVPAAFRARDLSVLPRARCADHGSAAFAHGPHCVQFVLARHPRRAVGALAMGRVSAAQLDAVTIDAYGTLLTI